MEEREKACPSAPQVLADGPDSGLWSLCFSPEMRCWGKKERKRRSLHLHPRHVILADALRNHTHFFTK